MSPSAARPGPNAQLIVWDPEAMRVDGVIDLFGARVEPVTTLAPSAAGGLTYDVDGRVFATDSAQTSRPPLGLT
ncbi:MAG TPA: hypothetical protein VMG12_02295 [Polyangiaceae bacterium]|nr:hypothetical protein [Polyangiaceae bacterium]